eukprot:jgi/Mesvir1/29717/Mv00949-RA.2
MSNRKRKKQTDSLVEEPQPVQASRSVAGVTPAVAPTGSAAAGSSQVSRLAPALAGPSVASGSGAPANRATYRRPIQDDDVDAQEDDASEDNGLTCIGRVEVKIVGIQYYTGTVNNKEMVNLVREPQNPYDRNAIRVDNILRVQVGHVERYKAAALAPLLDAQLVRCEAVVPRGSNNVYKMPCNVFLFTADANKDAVVRKLASAGLPVIPLTGADASEYGDAMAGSQEERRASGGPLPPSMTQTVTIAAMEDELDMLFENLEADRAFTELMEADASIIQRTLFPHQKECLSWMVGRENNSSLPPFWQPVNEGGKVMYLNTITNHATQARPASLRGGILADDMGLGKTLTLLALIATNRPGAQLPPVERVPRSMVPTAEAAGSKGKRPKAAEKKAKPAADKPLKNAVEVADPPPQVPAANGPKSTLVITPLTVLSNWTTQLEEHTASGRLSVYQHYGPNRSKDPAFIAKHDVVLSTYGILLSDGLTGPLQKVDWLRVVLDEAHNIKSTKALVSKAAYALKSERRWLVTGTPIQNQLSDLQSLMQFLRLEPLSDRSFWLRTIERPLKLADPRGLARLQVLMRSVAMRRTKETRVNGAMLVDIPPKTVAVQSVPLSDRERQRYDEWEEYGRKLVSRLISQDAMLKNYSSVLEIILRLRQICDHLALCPHGPPSDDNLPTPRASGSSSAPSERADADSVARIIALLKAGGDDDCPICLSALATPCITRCAHVFCKRCIEAVLTRGVSNACPMCRAPVAKESLTVVLPDDLDDAPAVSGDSAAASSKIAALVAALRACVFGDGDGGSGIKAASCGNGGNKAVVFSQFASMLSLIEPALKAAGIRYVRIDGSVPNAKRASIISSFCSASEDAPSVILMTLKSGGVGINLTAASHVFLMEPWCVRPWSTPGS